MGFQDIRSATAVFLFLSLLHIALGQAVVQPDITTSWSKVEATSYVVRVSGLTSTSAPTLVISLQYIRLQTAAFEDPSPIPVTVTSAFMGLDSSNIGTYEVEPESVQTIMKGMYRVKACSGTTCVRSAPFVVTEAVRSGFQTNILARNDDGSSPSRISLGFDYPLEFFQNVTGVWVNNNGFLTVNNPSSSFTPSVINAGTGEIIFASFWADTDSRSYGNPVAYGMSEVDGHKAFGMTHFNADYYSGSTSHNELLNTFQVLIIDRSDVRPGDFDVEFNYDVVRWETGTASSGNSFGKNGQSARAGFTNGRSYYYEFRGSGVNGAFLDNGTRSLAANSTNSNVPGRHYFAVRDGLFASDAVITSISPSTVSSSGGAVVTIMGEQFVAGESGVSVTCGGAAATNVQVLLDSMITFVAPAKPSSVSAMVPVDVVVTSASFGILQSYSAIKWASGAVNLIAVVDPSAVTLRLPEKSLRLSSMASHLLSGTGNLTYVWSQSASDAIMAEFSVPADGMLDLSNLRAATYNLRVTVTAGSTSDFATAVIRILLPQILKLTVCIDANYTQFMSSGVGYSYSFLSRLCADISTFMGVTITPDLLYGLTYASDNGGCISLTFSIRDPPGTNAGDLYHHLLDEIEAGNVTFPTLGYNITLNDPVLATQAATVVPPNVTLTFLAPTASTVNTRGVDMGSVHYDTPSFWIGASGQAAGAGSMDDAAWSYQLWDLQTMHEVMGVLISYGEEVLVLDAPLGMYALNASGEDQQGNKGYSTMMMFNITQRTPPPEATTTPIPTRTNGTDPVMYNPHCKVCREASDGMKQPCTLRCNGQPRDWVIDRISFASWGTPSGQCFATAGGQFTRSSCHSQKTWKALRNKCQGMHACEVELDDKFLGGRRTGACAHVHKWLKVLYNCKPVHA